MTGPKIARILERFGWRVRKGKGTHLVAYPPDVSQPVMTLHKTYKGRTAEAAWRDCRARDPRLPEVPK